MRIIEITGNDGSGKSTLIRHLTELDPGYSEVSVWDAMDRGLFPDKDVVDRYLCSLNPDARLLFLAHALSSSVEKAGFEKELIFNGYFHKYFATELSLGADRGLVDALISYFKTPDLIIYLDVDPEVAAGRKNRFTRYECGLKDPNRDDFLEFQKTLPPFWEVFDRQNWVVIDANRDFEQVLKDVTEVIK